jgi:CBS domain-containing protein
MGFEEDVLKKYFPVIFTEVDLSPASSCTGQRRTIYGRGPATRSSLAVRINPAFLIGGIMKAKDLMIPLQDYLKPDNTIKVAVNLLRIAKKGEEKVGLKGLPVLDSNGKLVGFLSVWDILKAVHPEYLSMMNLGEFTWDGMVEALAKQIAEKKVAVYMTKNVITVKEEDPLMECVDYMIKNNVTRLPVLDKTGKVVGMIYDRDVFFVIVKAMLYDDFYFTNT